MNAATNAAAKPPARRNSYRWIRQIHLWIGAWGALAAVVYGFTGLVMNHRFGEAAWPQGDSQETARSSLQVPEHARATPEALSLWLRQTQGLEPQAISKGPPPSPNQAQKWSISGGSASHSWSIDYALGSDTADLKHSTHTPLAAFNRLHKAVGGGWAWTLLADSFAIGMLLLGLSGIWMWARGRTPKQMLASVLGLSVLVLAVVAGPALLA